MQRKTEAAHPILCRFGFVTHGRAKEGSRGVLCQVTDTLRQEVGDPDFWVQNLGNSVFGLQIPSFASSEDWSNNSNGTYDVQIRARSREYPSIPWLLQCGNRLLRTRSQRIFRTAPPLRWASSTSLQVELLSEARLSRLCRILQASAVCQPFGAEAHAAPAKAEAAHGCCRPGAAPGFMESLVTFKAC